VTAVEIAVEIVGWAGAALILFAYLLLSAGKFTGQSLAYQAMNVVGAAGFIVNGWWHGALPSATLNVLWLMIGLFASIRILKRRRAPAR
jgi:inner membrane protein involved in colicin E2 resistance